jgi:hypothetical protein
LALPFFHYSFHVHHPVNWDDWHLLPHAMASCTWQCRSQCYVCLEIFSTKILFKELVAFDSKSCYYLTKLIRTMAFKTNVNSFRMKLVKITENCIHKIDRTNFCQRTMRKISFQNVEKKLSDYIDNLDHMAQRSCKYLFLN